MGLHLIPNNLNINFVGFRKVSYIISILLILAGVISLAVKGGPRYGIDFAGGATVQVKFEKPISDEAVKQSLQGAGLPDLVVQQFGDDGMSYLLRVSATEEDSTGIDKVVRSALDERIQGNGYEIQRL